MSCEKCDLAMKTTSTFNLHAVHDIVWNPVLSVAVRGEFKELAKLRTLAVQIAGKRPISFRNEGSRRAAAARRSRSGASH